MVRRHLHERDLDQWCGKERPHRNNSLLKARFSLHEIVAFLTPGKIVEFSSPYLSTKAAIKSFSLALFLSQTAAQ